MAVSKIGLEKTAVKAKYMFLSH